MAADIDKREKERVAIRGALGGEVMVFQPMTVLDISHGGAQIETPFRLQLDSLHDFRLFLGDRSVIVKGRIVYCRIGTLVNGVISYRSGVEFTEPSQHAKNAIAFFVDALRLAKHQPPIIDADVADDAS
jgi:hypothetical protein